MTKSVVQEIGGLVPTFKEEKIVILFGPQAPKELRELAVIHEFEILTVEPLKEGGTIQFGEESFTITALGSLANKNFQELGHISIYFQEPAGEILPGSVFAAPYQFPTLTEGTVITIF